LIVKLGGEHVTIKNLALEIGLSEAAIYRHFPNKSAIYHFLIDYAERILLADLSYASDDEFIEFAGLDFLMKKHVANVVKRRGIFFQVFTEVVSMGDRQLNKEAVNAINNYITYVSSIFSRNTNSEYFRKDSDPACLAFIFYALLQSLVNFWTLSGYSFDLKSRFDNVWSNYRISQ
jgi:AcrR family transcriptional regulator